MAGLVELHPYPRSLTRALSLLGIIPSSCCCDENYDSVQNMYVQDLGDEEVLRIAPYMSSVSYGGPPLMGEYLFNLRE
jgi:hypothetical protein